MTKHGRGKLHSIETENDAQACNVKEYIINYFGLLSR